LPDLPGPLDGAPGSVLVLDPSVKLCP